MTGNLSDENMNSMLCSQPHRNHINSMIPGLKLEGEKEL